MTLVLQIEYLSGVCFAAVGPESTAADWPPQPDRVFSALVASWAARGSAPDEGEALEWLEKLPPPAVAASSTEARTSAIVFVPPNDPRSGRQKNARGVVPALRNRQPRRFPASRPHDPIVFFYWRDARPPAEILKALSRVAHDTAYVGHSTSLTRCRFFMDDAPSVDGLQSPKRQVYQGRLAELRRAFERGYRPLPGTPLRPRAASPPVRTNVFDRRWLLLEHVEDGGHMPDVRAAAVVSRVIRDALLSGYRQENLGDAVPEEISGHTVDGKPSRRPHLAIIPLPFIGFPYADGHVLGFALVPPAGSTLLDDPQFLRVLRRLAPVNEERGRRLLQITTREGTPRNQAFSIELSPAFEPARRSLDPDLYLRPARIFASVTPIVLDRHLKGDGAARQDEIETLIVAACRNIGLPEPVSVTADKHSALEGAPSAYPSAKSPRWMRWRLPQPIGTRQLVHAVIRFPSIVEGPVILGAGRYHGLGLCRPLRDGR